MSRRVNAHNLEAYYRARRWTFLLLALGCFLAVPAYLAIRNHWPKEVRERLAALVDEGVPINLAAVQTQFYPPIPDEENGAIACQKAFERIRKCEWSWDCNLDVLAGYEMAAPLLALVRPRQTQTQRAGLGVAWQNKQCTIASE
jgi:hypothetical protein